MFSTFAQAAVLALGVQASAAAFVRRQTTSGVIPLGSSTDVFTEGGACKASWTPDTSGASTWKSMTIDLMTGANLDMKKLATVASGVDGTDPSNTSLTYECPSVSPNAAIYFLQYTYGAEQDPTWTTRFAIASTSGKVSTAPHANQPAGGSPAIPWGNGKLTGSSASATTLSSASGSSSSDSSSSGSEESGSSASESTSSDASSSGSTTDASASSTSTPMQAASSTKSSTSGASSNMIKSAGLPVALAAALAISFL